MRQGRAGAMSGWWPGVSEERGGRSRPTRADAGRPRPVPRSLARRGGRAVSVICLLSIQVALVAALAVLEAAPHVGGKARRIAGVDAGPTVLTMRWTP